MDYRIASWNILNDSQVPKHAPQAERLQQITHEINIARNGSKRYVQFICEAESLAHIQKIASATNLKIVGRPVQYRRDFREFMAFLVDRDTAKSAASEALYMGNRQESILQLTVHGKNIIGCHMPYYPIRELRLRYEHLHRIYEANPSVFMGDFNATPFFPMRLSITSHGYHEAHKHKRPPFPYPTYRGQNIPSLLPTLNIDALYYQPQVSVKRAKFSLNPGSDHPLIWADVQL